MEVVARLDLSQMDRELARSISRVVSPETMRSLNEQVGEYVLGKVKDHLSQMSVTRHKVADRLGAPYSKYLEDAATRAEVEKADEGGATIVIKNTPGLSRAYHDLHITPKRARALTIPLDRISAHKGARQLEREDGIKIFRPKGTNILADTVGKGKNARLRPLYALVRSVTVPRDPGLLPSDETLIGWTRKSASSFLRTMEELG